MTQHELPQKLDECPESARSRLKIDLEVVCLNELTRHNPD